MKLVTCFVKTAETNKDFNLLSEEEKTELANALQAKALKALAVQTESINVAEDAKESEEETQIENTQEE